MLEHRALRADPVCCFVELAVNFFVQSFMLPCCATAFNDSSGTNIGMGFRSVITDTEVTQSSVQIVRKLTQKSRDIGIFCNISGETLAEAVHFPLGRGQPRPAR